MVGETDWAPYGSAVPGSGENEENRRFRLIQGSGSQTCPGAKTPIGLFNSSRSLRKIYFISRKDNYIFKYILCVDINIHVYKYIHAIQNYYYHLSNKTSVC